MTIAPVSRNSKAQKILYISTIILVIGLFGFAIYKWVLPEDMSPFPLAKFQKEYKLVELLPPEIDDQDRYKGISMNSEIYRGQKAFDEQKYQLAIKHFERALQDAPERFDIALYRAQAYLHLGNKDKSLVLFAEIIEHPDKPFHRKDALWFTALIYLKSGDLSNCRLALDQLISLNSVHEDLLEKAIKMREQLDR